LFWAISCTVIAAAAEPFALVERLRERREVLLIAGNHDRKLQDVKLIESWKSHGFYFHHGNEAVESCDCIQVIGHHHPAGVVRDGAGLRLKLPALVQQERCWIMPAFSPWAAGTEWPRDGQSRIWLCSPQRIFRFDQNE
jgi:uncharacterized protein